MRCFHSYFAFATLVELSRSCTVWFSRLLSVNDTCLNVEIIPFLLLCMKFSHPPLAFSFLFLILIPFIFLFPSPVFTVPLIRIELYKGTNKDFFAPVKEALRLIIQTWRTQRRWQVVRRTFDRKLLTISGRALKELEF